MVNFKIRPVVLGVIIRNNKILVGKGYDKITKQTFYRCLGGEIEFQEKSEDALKREFLEEIQKEIIVGNFLGTTENIFTYNGQKGHEIVFFYSASLNDSDFQEEYIITEEGNQYQALWVGIEDFKNKKSIIYPESILKYL